MDGGPAPDLSAPEFALDVVDDAGVRWSGSVRMVPPLLEGTVSGESGDVLAVSGVIRGRRSDMRDAADRLSEPFTLKQFMPLRNRTVDLLVPPWVRIAVQAGPAAAVLEVRAGNEVRLTAHRGLRRIVADAALLPWLRTCLDGAERMLRAHPTPPVSAATAWEVARLHLLFDEGEPAAAAAAAGVALLGPSTARADDRSAGLVLAGQLDVFGLTDAAAELRGALER